MTTEELRESLLAAPKNGYATLTDEQFAVLLKGLGFQVKWLKKNKCPYVKAFSSDGKVLSELESNPNAEKGEFTLIIEVPEKVEEAAAPAPSSPHAALIDEMIAGAETLRDAIEAVLSKENTPFKKNDLKEAAIRLKELFE